MQVHLKDGTWLSLATTPFASGGEGDLFKILSPSHLSQHIIKLYKSGKTDLRREQKMTYLVANPPALHVQHGHSSVVWPSYIALAHNQFAGFVMPLAKGEKLEFLCHSRLPKHLGTEWRKFDFAVPGALELRQKICFNIAVAMFDIHRLGSYVLVDMKPENVMIQSNGLVALIDTDSVEVMQNGKVLFPAPVATPEYTPPEFYKGTKPENGGVSETWDRFSMAVIFYRLLTGIHPFSGSCKPPFDKCVGVADMVENGLFAAGKLKNHFHTVPPPHQHFKKLPPDLQALFVRCFEQGHHQPLLRPSAEEWCRALAPQLHVPHRASHFANVEFPTFYYSEGLLSRFSTSLLLPPLHFLKLNGLDGLQIFAKILLGTSPKLQLREQIEQLQQEIHTFLRKKEGHEKALVHLQTQFHNHQSDILAKEKEKAAKLNEWFTEKLRSLEKSLLLLQEKEKKELKKVESIIVAQLKEMQTEHKLKQRRWKYLEATGIERVSAIQEQMAALEKEEESAKAASAQAGVVSRLAETELQKARLQESLTALQIRHTHEIYPLQQALEKNEMYLKQQEAMQKNGSHELLQNTTQKYTRQASILHLKAQELVQTARQKLDVLLADTQQKLQENLQKSTLQYNRLQKESDAFLHQLNQMLQALYQQQEKYKRW